ncbi:MAG TPA: class I SAM-dependent methyltransferase [Candidatus Hydrogenedentes bacterium]|nr:class I SAM-dependent methyltransferase [Candidatus Hydrogenedentota bacterium]
MSKEEQKIPLSRNLSANTSISRESAPHNTHGKVYALLRDHLECGQVLDVPCGSGAFLRRLLDSPFSAWGADIVHHPAVPEGVVFTLADMNETLPFPDAQFDAVVSIKGIEHIRRPFDFLAECARILKPCGLLILTTPNISALRSRWRWLLTGFHNKGKFPLDESNPLPRHHINLLSYPQLRYMVHTTGLRIERRDTNHIKAASWLYLPLLPLTWLITRWVLWRGAKNQALGR